MRLQYDREWGDVPPSCTGLAFLPPKNPAPAGDSTYCGAWGQLRRSHGTGGPDALPGPVPEPFLREGRRDGIRGWSSPQVPPGQRGETPRHPTGGRILLWLLQNLPTRKQTPVLGVNARCHIHPMPSDVVGPNPSLPAPSIQPKGLSHAQRLESTKRPPCDRWPTRSGNTRRPARRPERSPRGRGRTEQRPLSPRGDARERNRSRASPRSCKKQNGPKHLTDATTPP